MLICWPTRRLVDRSDRGSHINWNMKIQQALWMNWLLMIQSHLSMFKSIKKKTYVVNPRKVYLGCNIDFFLTILNLNMDVESHGWQNLVNGEIHGWHVNLHNSYGSIALTTAQRARYARVGRRLNRFTSARWQWPGGFHSHWWDPQTRCMVYFMENPKITWRKTGGTINWKPPWMILEDNSWMIFHDFGMRWLVKHV